MSRNEPPIAVSGSWPSMRASPGLHDEQVREHVRQVARDGQQAVVHARVDRDRRGAERGQQAVQVAQAGGLGLGQRREVPGRALEQLGAGVLRAARLHAGDRVAADEARAQPGRHRRDDAGLGRADVGDRRLRRQRGELRQHGRAARSRARTARRARRPRRPPPGRRRPRRRSRASRAASSAPGSGSKPTTRPTPARSRAARPSEPPISPSPTIARRWITRVARRRASTRPGGRPGRATGARSGADRRATCSASRAAPRAPPRHRRGTR